MIDWIGNTSLRSIFLDSVENYSQRTFLRWFEGEKQHSLTYEQVAEKVLGIDKEWSEKLSNSFVLVTEDVVSTIQITLWAVCKGIPLSIISPVASPRFVAFVAAKTSATAIVVDESARSRFVELPNLISLASIRGSKPEENSSNLLAELSGPSSEFPKNITYLYQATSGTTGDPKLFIRSHAPFIRTANQLRTQWDLDSSKSNRFLAIQALTHGAGHQFLWTPIALGAEIVVPNAIGSKADIGEIKALAPHFVFLAPRMLSALADKNGGTVRGLFGKGAVVMVGAASPREELLQELHDDGIEVVQNYGSTECGDLIRTPLGHWRKGWCGPALPDVEVEVAEDGELMVRSPVQASTLSDKAYTTDFFATGDFAEIESSSSWIRILGRKRDVFNTLDGSNIFPIKIEAELEHIVNSKVNIEQAIAFGDQRPFVVAIVVTQSSSSELLEAIRLMNQGLEPNEQVRRVLILRESFPTDVYHSANLDKVARKRTRARQVFATQLELLYRLDDTLPRLDELLVL